MRTLLSLVSLLALPNSILAQDLQLQFDSGELSQCRRLFAVVDEVPVDEAGFFCLVIDPLVTDSILVSYATSDGWLMEETSAWFNTDIDELPTNKEGEPRLDRFPYTGEDDIDPNEPVSTWGFDLPLEDVGVPACGGDVPFPLTGTNVLGVAYASLYKFNETTDEETETDGWVDGVLPTDPDVDLWTLFNFTLQCVPAQTAAPTLPPTTAFPTPAPVPITPAPVPITPAPFFTPAPVTAAPITPPPVSPSPTTMPPLVEDGGMCDDGADCQSGACSQTGFCLLSTGSPCDSDILCGTGTCINGICNTCDGSDPSILTQELMDQSFAAAQLTQSLQLGYQENPPSVTATNVNFYNSGSNNEAMVAKVNGVCYGVFAPEEKQDLATFGTTPVTTFQQTCSVHARAHSAYFTDERQFLELQLGQCASTCAGSSDGALSVSGQGPQPIAFRNEVISVQSIIPQVLFNQACPIVLTGHGLGGATAVVGSMTLADLQPTVITFGAPRTVQPDCGLLTPTSRSQTQYRFVNLAFVPSYSTSLFDSIPQLGDGTLAHYGNPIFLDEMETIVLPLNDDTTRAHVYDGDNSADPSNDVNTPHRLDLYNTNIAALNMESCFPIPAGDSWQNGHWCDQGDVCTSERCRAFVTLGDGLSTGLCAAKGLDGEACLENGDCVSGSCNVGACLGDFPSTPATPAPATAPPVTKPPTNPPGTSPPVTAPTNPPGTAPPGPTGDVDSCGACTADAECQSGVCKTFNVQGAPGGTTSVCAETALGTMSVGCFCTDGNNAECTDGRCEGDASGTLFLCFSPLAPCQACDENSDCLSGNCEQNVCGLQSGGLPDECGGGGNAPPADCLFCEMDDADGCTSIGPNAQCMMGVCTQDNGLLALGCGCMPGENSGCESEFCGRSDNGMTFECQVDPDGESAPEGDGEQIAPLRVNGSVGDACMVGPQCDSGSCTSKCDGSCTWTCD